ncbi:MAG TPA: hypothetical protein VGF75_02325 [Candidatus Saccharimonadales bacterium]
MPELESIGPEPVRLANGQLSRCQIDRRRSGQEVNGYCEMPDCHNYIYHLGGGGVMGGESDMIIDCVRRVMQNGIMHDLEERKQAEAQPIKQGPPPAPKIRPKWLDLPLEDFEPFARG